jgi:hypothetical protein
MEGIFVKIGGLFEGGDDENQISGGNWLLAFGC